ncbi:MAG: NAD(P)-dependent alcohol dehydrogenase [Candidatus Thorarchaeota archaeon]
MKAIVCPRYGPPEVLELREVKKPIPKKDEILIKIHATAVILGDCELRGQNFPHYGIGMKFLIRLGFGIRGPRKKILGQQCAGEIEAIGEDVTLFKLGDQVFAATEFGLGTYAEYTCMPEDGIVSLKPSNMSYEEASTIPIGGTEALHYMNKAELRQGQKVLINGAGGSIGTIAIQLAKSKGAEVTAVDSAGKYEMLTSIGADYFIDYKQENFHENGERYDVIFDVVGVTHFSDCLNSLDENGVYLQGNGSISRGNKSLAEKHGMKALAGPAKYSTENLTKLRELIESGTVKTIIDRSFSLDEMVEAHRFVEQGGKKGNVTIAVIASE